VALPVPQGGGPIELRLRAGGREARSVIVRGVWPDRAAAAADLVAVVPVRVDPGRVATVEIELDPPVVDAGPGAHTQVTARFLDRSGNLATSALPTVTSTEGNLRPAPFGTDGASRWEIDLLPGFRERRVTVTARSEILDVEESAEVLVRPRPVRATIGATGGLQTNFSSLVAPSLSLDVTGLVRFRPQATVARPSRTRLFAFGSAAWYRADGQEATDVGATGTIRMHLLPVTGGLAVRQEYPAQAFWFGLGIQVVPFWGTLDFGLEQPWASSGGVLSPALAGVLGYGVRVPGGELVVELRGSSATSPGGSTSLSGYVGGLSAMFGYRWIIPATRRRE
ncbi:MAG TPA: hypothetical protein PKA64_12810, partial [Myxococcota bacterium]|nr:hypothetical protein [Myxococcota bacterium]